LLISIIIVNYNTGTILKQCIDSIFEFEDPSEYEIIIVDNYSNDGPRAYIDVLLQKYKNIKCIYLDRTESFSHANNMGISQAQGDYILIMNPDIIFVEHVFHRLTALLEEDKSIGAVCPALLGKDGKFQNNYFRRYPSLTQYLFFYTFTAKLFERNRQLTNQYLRNEIIDINTNKVYKVEQIPCAFFLTYKQLIIDIGLMDENFVLFFEDVDLSYRIHKRFQLLLDTRIKVTHLGGMSFGKEYKTLMYGRFLISMNYFFKKHYGKLRQFLLKAFSEVNSSAVITFEYIKKIFNISNDTRLEKHKIYLKLLRNT